LPRSDQKQAAAILGDAEIYCVQNAVWLAHPVADLFEVLDQFREKFGVGAGSHPRDVLHDECAGPQFVNESEKVKYQGIPWVF
jgi:hypothetical protein